MDYWSGYEYLSGSYGVLKPPQPFHCFPVPGSQGSVHLGSVGQPHCCHGVFALGRALLWCATGSEVALLL